MAVDKGMKVLEIYARDRRFPVSFHLLVVFGAVLVMTMVVGSREPINVAVMSATLLAAYLAVLLPNRRLFSLSADAKRLMKFMGLKGRKGRIRFCVATFHDTRATDIDGHAFSYSSLPRNDVEAMVEFVALLAKHDLVEETRNPLKLLIDETQAGDSALETLVYIGGPRVSRYVGALVREDRVVSYEPGEKGEEIAIAVAGGLNRRYSMRPPSPEANRTDDDTLHEDTYACAMKRVEIDPTRIAVWGLDARGTLAAAHWLATHWSRFESLYDIGLEDSFTAIVRVPREDRFAANPVRAVCDDPIPLLLPAEEG